mmetsp:Transcript_3263/g.9308  ORF Transcript_3263/g.9308 Transcript_3263/m.9308 type:complete len:99 (-) Transcript_3263:280-576(-)|eukprot:CAMPEP_0117697918 /NCGR_PEP_ID=MMETSP0804-20121206/29492_1 /TAXON_ID=1074897 /ORGANISM="Tetraselmis astigmatica, Strain CCMP880" /LENGTH=98 /DNA_ID=CAMNT_0005512215 /DNA_START=449 /DNA_END=745 /DNA_ORIENTATION=+
MAGEQVDLPGEVSEANGSDAPAGGNSGPGTREGRKAAKKAKNKAESQLKRNVSWKDDKKNNEDLVQVKEYRVSDGGGGGGGEHHVEMDEPQSTCCVIC